MNSRLYMNDSIPRTTSARRLVALGLLAVVTLIGGCRTPEGTTPAEQRKHIRAESEKILNAVYAEYPSAREAVSKAAGYGTFSNIEYKMMLAGSGNGYGLAVDRKSNKLTYMSLRKLQVGFGAGIQEFRLLVIFKDRAKFDQFEEGVWHFGGGADLSVQEKDAEEGIDGGLQATVELDPMVYQVTEQGINLSATADGIRYAQDDALN